MNELDETTFRKMTDLAKNAATRAYAPYSRYCVGASVLATDGEIFAGCNVENASYGLTICAERNAVFKMVHDARMEIRAVVLYTPTQKPVLPCGACRQVINEFGPSSLIVSVCDGAGVLTRTLPALLPDAFGPSNLH